MEIRLAIPDDVPAMHAIRLRVRENRLSDPSVVTEPDYLAFMARDTRSWVCTCDDGTIAGFTMVDVENRNLWALFVAPEHEGKGVGRALHEAMCAWYFTRAIALRLSTASDTRAEAFYRKAGYRPDGHTPSGERIFELRPTKGAAKD
ncbi:MAG: GNAT family N-acetyltransferase [Flavobacteriales bacterium]